MLGAAGFTASAPDAFISRPSADGARDAALGILFPPAGQATVPKIVRNLSEKLLTGYFP